jgi:glycosyltransferase involved in cell wall biosynthesis
VQLVALVHSTDHVCCRYRLAAFRDALERAGHSLSLRRLPRRWWSRLRLFHELRGASVVLQRFLLPRWQLALLRRAARHLVLDFDDAVFLRDSWSARRQHHARRLRRFAATVGSCDAVLAGNRFLADHAARFAGAGRVFLLPTCVDPARYHPRPAPGAGDELVWIGTSSTLRGLEAVSPLLDGLARELPDIRLKVICNRFPTLRHLPVVESPWSRDTEAEELASSDVGISWVPDDQWSRGKCGLKVLQYMAAGLPVVANPVGVHTELVRHGETGYLVSTAQQWHEAIARLRADGALRQRMGQAGRWHFESSWTVASGASVWLDVLEHLQGALARAG